MGNDRDFHCGDFLSFACMPFQPSSTQWDILRFYVLVFIKQNQLTRSSEPSVQSASPSQRHLFVIHVPSPHLKLSSLHFNFGQLDSSLLSPQSLLRIEKDGKEVNTHAKKNNQT